jgi:hypothetical protein
VFQAKFLTPEIFSRVVCFPQSFWQWVYHFYASMSSALSGSSYISGDRRKAGAGISGPLTWRGESTSECLSSVPSKFSSGILSFQMIADGSKSSLACKGKFQ